MKGGKMQTAQHRGSSSRLAWIAKREGKSVAGVGLSVNCAGTEACWAKLRGVERWAEDEERLEADIVKTNLSGSADTKRVSMRRGTACCFDGA